MDIEQKWLEHINKLYKSNKKNTKTLTRDKLDKIGGITELNKINKIGSDVYTFAEVKNIKTILENYKLPKIFVAYVDGVEDTDIDKLFFSKDDVLFFVVDDSTDIVELMLNEYYTNYIYLIPKKYLAIDKRNYYKILNYNKLEIITKNERNFQRIDIFDKKSYIKETHQFIMLNLILGKK